MTWTKLSDDFSDDCWQLSDGAFRLHVEALNWSNRKLLDCRIPKGDVARFARNGACDADELVAVGWWKDAGKFYDIHHHAVYQRPKEQVIKLQKRNQANGQSGGRPKQDEIKPAREVWGSDNPDGLRDGMPDGNPKGQDRTGQARDGTEVLNEEAASDPWSFSKSKSVPSPQSLPSADCACGKPLQSADERWLGTCERCNRREHGARRSA